VPSFDVLAVVSALVGIGVSDASIRLARGVRRRFWKSVSESWPTAQAIVRSGRVESTRGQWVVSAPYSFYAAGDRYGGRYERGFGSESKAQDALQRLLGSPPVVRYKPDDPDRSVLVEG
jgi:hypothetical protein